MAKEIFVQEQEVQTRTRKKNEKLAVVPTVDPQVALRNRIISLNGSIVMSFSPLGTLGYTDLDGNRRTVVGSFASVGNASGRAVFSVTSGRNTYQASSLSIDVQSDKLYALLPDGKTAVIDTRSSQAGGGSLQFNYAINNRTYPVILNFQINTNARGSTFNELFNTNVAGGDEALSSFVRITAGSGTSSQDQGVRGKLQIPRNPVNPNSYSDISAVYYTMPRTGYGASSHPQIYTMDSSGAQSIFSALPNEVAVSYRVGTGGYRSVGPRIELGL